MTTDQKREKPSSSSRESSCRLTRQKQEATSSSRNKQTWTAGEQTPPPTFRNKFVGGMQTLNTLSSFVNQIKVSFNAGFFSFFSYPRWNSLLAVWSQMKRSDLARFRKRYETKLAPVVVQLSESSLPAPEVRGSSLINATCQWTHFYQF